MGTAQIEGMSEIGLKRGRCHQCQLAKKDHLDTPHLDVESAV